MFDKAKMGEWTLNETQGYCEAHRCDGTCWFWSDEKFCQMRCAPARWGRTDMPLPFTDEERADAKTLSRILVEMEEVVRMDSGALFASASYGRTVSMRREAFPSLRAGERVSIKDIFSVAEKPGEETYG